jgi:hypothetical protein
MFRSGKSVTLHGFAADPKGDRLPPKFAPWTVTGVVRPDQRPPHGLSRSVIESGIATYGFQLWRIRKS